MAAAAAVYISVAWSVAPGFYDSFAPPTPYAFTCPPSIAGANVAPRSGHEVIPVSNGVSDSASPFTDDGQVIIGFLPGSFNAAGRSSVTVDIDPLSTCAAPPGLTFSTNIYKITADAPLVKQATLVMEYSNFTASPSYIYRADNPDGPWTNIGAGSQARLWTINTKTDRLGYFAAGYSMTKSSGGNQLLPATVALLIVAVLFLSVPMAVVRRRRAR